MSGLSFISTIVTSEGSTSNFGCNLGLGLALGYVSDLQKKKKKKKNTYEVVVDRGR